MVQGTFKPGVPIVETKVTEMDKQLERRDEFAMTALCAIMDNFGCDGEFVTPLVVAAYDIADEMEAVRLMTHQERKDLKNVGG
jgi:hypothetical protein